MDLLLDAIPKNGKLEFENKEDYRDYCLENEGVPHLVHARKKVRQVDKERMYAYYYKVIIPLAEATLRNLGWHPMNEAIADYILKCEHAMHLTENEFTGEEMKAPMTKTEMTKERMHTFLSDVIFFLESHSIRVPDAKKYKIEKIDGKSFKRI